MRETQVLLVLMYLLLSAGCATTRFSHESPCLKVLKPGSRVLVPWVPGANEEFYVRGLKKVYNKRNIEITSVHEQEWNLMASGVLDPLDSSSNAALQTLGFTHLFLIQELSYRSEIEYGYYTSLELSLENATYPHKRYWEGRWNQSKLLLQLIPLDDIKAMNSVVAETVVSPMVFGNKTKGETYINPTTVESARYKAMMKASKRIIKKCCRK